MHLFTRLLTREEGELGWRLASRGMPTGPPGTPGLEVPTVQEPAVTVRNRRFRFWKLLNRNRTARVFRGYGFGFGFGFEPTVFRRFFTVPNHRFFAVPAWFHSFLAVFRWSGLEPPGTGGPGTVSIQKFLNLNRTTVQKLTVSDRINSHGFGCNRLFSKPWAGLLSPIRN